MGEGERKEDAQVQHTQIGLVILFKIISCNTF